MLKILGKVALCTTRIRPFANGNSLCKMLRKLNTTQPLPFYNPGILPLIFAMLEMFLSWNISSVSAYESMRYYNNRWCAALSLKLHRQSYFLFLANLSIALESGKKQKYKLVPNEIFFENTYVEVFPVAIFIF